jgi:modification methylase
MTAINQILVGHAAWVLTDLPDGCVALIVTSPPYHQGIDGYEEYLDDLMAVFRQCVRVLRPNGKLCIDTMVMPIPNKLKKAAGIKQHTRIIRNIPSDLDQRIVAETSMKPLSYFIWAKQTTELIHGAYPYPGNNLENNTSELIAVYVKPGAPPKFPQWVKDGNKLSLTEHRDLTQQIWWMRPADTARKGDHLAPFPEKLPARLIRLYTYGAVGDFTGEVVVDPFVGTGTTCAVAKMMRRRFVGIDVESRYVQLAQHRVDAAIVGDWPVFFVGAPKFLTEKELEQLPEVQVRLAGAKAEAKHKRQTFGRAASNCSSPQLPPFPRPLTRE